MAREPTEEQSYIAALEQSKHDLEVENKLLRKEKKELFNTLVAVQAKYYKVGQ